jgi:hypothetical protein
MAGARRSSWRGGRGGGGEEKRPLPRCHATAARRKCKDAHADYYKPILRAMAEDLEAAQPSGSEPAPSSSPEPPPASGEEVGQKNQADDVVPGSDNNKEYAAASLSENLTKFS